MPLKKIKKALKKSHPHIVKKAKKPFKLKYPKLFLLIFSIILAYYLFSNPLVSENIIKLQELSYIGIFLSGILIAFGFSAPFSVGFLIVSQPQNILLATFCGAMGAALSDILIFKFIKFSFMNEFKELEKTSVLKKIRGIVNKNINLKIKRYLVYIFAGILIATPLPDELGVVMLAGLTTIKPKILMGISFVLHSIAIFLILYISFVL